MNCTVDASEIEAEDWTSCFSAEELAEMDYADTMREIETAATLREATWSTLRREIMIRGGLAAGAYTRHYLPGQTYRVHGLAVDVMAADLADEGWGSWECAEDFLATLWKLWETEQAARAARVRRTATVEPVAETETTETETSDVEHHTADAGMPVLRVVSGTAAVGAGRDDRRADLPMRRAGLRTTLGRRGRPGRAPARGRRGRSAPTRLTRHNVPRVVRSYGRAGSRRPGARSPGTRAPSATPGPRSWRRRGPTRR